jgi:hypothetical protein
MAIMLQNKVRNFENYNDLFNHSTSLKQISHLLENNPGIFFGDNHADPHSALFMAEQMAFFKSHGIDTLYVELGRYHQKPLYEDFNARKQGADEKLFTVIEERWGQYGAVESRIAMIEAAREAGIEVLPVDRIRTEYPDSRDLHLEGWIGAMREEHRSGEEKYLLFGGKLHGTGKYSVADYLNIPTVVIKEQQGKRFPLVSYDALSEIRPLEEDSRQEYQLFHSITPQSLAKYIEKKLVYNERASNSWQDAAQLLTRLDTELNTSPPDILAILNMYADIHEITNRHSLPTWLQEHRSHVLEAVENGIEQRASISTEQLNDICNTLDGCVEHSSVDLDIDISDSEPPLTSTTAIQKDNKIPSLLR